MPGFIRVSSWILRLSCVAALTACGGGGGGGDGGIGGGGGNSGSGWVPGQFLPSDSFKAMCEAPRAGTSDIQGTVLDENNFLRSYSDETYLWYDEIVDQDPSLFDSPLDYFDVLMTNETTASGAPKDKFHFTMSTEEWEQLSQSGAAAGYGAQWVLISTRPPREAVVAYTEPDSPATDPGVDLARGAQVLAVDGVDLANGNDVDTLNAGLFPATAGETHTFTVRDLGSATTRQVTMTSEVVTSEPVRNVTTTASPTGSVVGYLLFNDHIAPAETGLIEAVEQLQAADIDELVVDLRYNGGGFLAIASQFAYMIAGDAQTGGRTFEEIRFNDKHPTTDPVTGEPLEPMPFIDQTLNFSEPAGSPLPSLDLQRVFVLTGPGTCSASESIMNSLRGIDVEVIQIGSTTCGKPYGFYPTDNCGTTYFTIQFQGVNEKGFGDYSDGFSPANNVVGTAVPGCSVADDFEHQLGDPLEARFQAALQYIGDGSCPAPTGLAAPGLAKPGAPPVGHRRHCAEITLAREPHPAAASVTLRSIVGLCCAGMALAACKTTPPVPYESSSADVSAVIVNPTTESRAELQRAVSHMLSGADVLLADDALTHSSTLSIERRRTGSVENPPLSGRDLGEPERFRLLLTGKGCLLVHESTQVAMPLTETDCVPEA